MIVDLTFNGKSTKEKGLYLKKFPSFSFSNEKYNSTIINGRRGALISNLNSYDNLKVSVSFLINGEYMKTIREIKQWLNGTGTLSFSDDSGIFYDVLKITYGTEDRKYYDRGTFEVTFICFPFEFVKGGETPFEWTAGYIENKYDTSFPIYELQSGTGFIDVDGVNFSFTNIPEDFVIDTRRKLVYGKNTKTSYLNKTQGDLDALILKKGRQSFSASPKMTVKPYWGYSL